jgi:hypothetical protein
MHGSLSHADAKELMQLMSGWEAVRGPGVDSRPRSGRMRRQAMSIKPLISRPQTSSAPRKLTSDHSAVREAGSPRPGRPA